jgi:hypothetical protein
VLTAANGLLRCGGQWRIDLAMYIAAGRAGQSRTSPRLAYGRPLGESRLARM